MDNERFFASVRQNLFDGSLSQDAVNGINAIISAFDRYGDGNVRHLAYCLATAQHETGRFRWLREIWGPTAAQRRYEGRADLGNNQAGDGKRFMGRGYVHITGRRNYADWSRRLGVDLVGNPDLAEDSTIAARVLVEGVIKGTFTGKKLADYASFTDMRRTVNGTDKAALIAGYASDFLAALTEAGWTSPPAEPAPQAPKRTRAVIRAQINDLLDELQTAEA